MNAFVPSPSFTTTSLAVLVFANLATPASAQKFEMVPAQGVYFTGGFAMDDYDGDGRVDASYWTGGQYRGTLVFLPGDGRGRFGPELSVPSTGGLFSHRYAPIAVDIDRDGILDLFQDLGGRVVLHRGHGNFVYDDPFIVAGFGVTSVGAIDAVDEEIDFIEHGTLHRGNGLGFFTAPEPFETEDVEGSAITDVNGDGLRDVVVWGEASYLRFFFATYAGNPRGGLDLLWRRDAILIDPRNHEVAVGDVTGDGVPDLVVTVRFMDELFIARGNGSGAFDLGNATRIVLPRGPGTPCLADFDLNGTLDVAVPLIDSRDVAILRSDGSGGFASPTFFRMPVPTPTACKVVEVNGDGRPDLAVELFFHFGGTMLMVNTTERELPAR